MTPAIVDPQPHPNKTADVGCKHCGSPVTPGGKFCPACGAALRPPEQCPGCQANVPDNARFCTQCGLQVLGARPTPPHNVAQATPRPSPSSNLMGNVLLVVAICSALLVAIYMFNKDAPKEGNPFQGEAMAPRSQAAPTPTPTVRTNDSASPAAGASITGTIELASSIVAPSRSGTVFIIVRNSGMPNRGPPIAVRRYQTESFPLNFSVSAADVMMEGMPFEGPFDLYVRWDADGDPMTKAPGDLVNKTPQSGVKPGESAVRIVLDEQLQ